MKKINSINDLPVSNAINFDNNLSILKTAIRNWIKEDLKIAQRQESGVDTKMIVAAMKWADRFNIHYTELQ